jgi:hypothetical protein
VGNRKIAAIMIIATIAIAIGVAGGIALEREGRAHLRRQQLVRARQHLRRPLLGLGVLCVGELLRRC